MFTACRPATDFLTELLASPGAAVDLGPMRNRGAGQAEYIEYFASNAPADVANTLREEFSSLPSLAITTLVDAWAQAQAGGKALHVGSVVPAEPIEFAKKRRVRITMDVEEERITILLSHLPNHHPS